MRRALALAAALSIMVILPYSVCAIERDPQPEESRMMELVNLERRNLKLQELKVDKHMIRAARCHCIDMWFKEYFAHTSPAPESKTPMDRYIVEVGKPAYAMVGENLYWSKTVKSMMEAHKALMASSTHKENIVSPRWTKIGAGFFETPDHEIFVTVMFVTTDPPK